MKNFWRYVIVNREEFYEFISFLNPSFDHRFLDNYYNYIITNHYHSGQPCNYRLFRDFLVDFSFIESAMNDIVENNTTWFEPIHILFRNKVVHCGVLFLYEIILYQKYSCCGLDSIHNNLYLYHFRDVVLLLSKNHFTWLDFDPNHLLGVFNLVIPLACQPELAYSVRTSYKIFKKSENTFTQMIDNIGAQFTDIYNNGTIYLAH